MGNRLDSRMLFGRSHAVYPVRSTTLSWRLCASKTAQTVSQHSWTCVLEVFRERRLPAQGGRDARLGKHRTSPLPDSQAYQLAVHSEVYAQAAGYTVRIWPQAAVWGCLLLRRCQGRSRHPANGPKSTLVTQSGPACVGARLLRPTRSSLLLRKFYCGDRPVAILALNGNSEAVEFVKPKSVHCSSLSVKQSYSFADQFGLSHFEFHKDRAGSRFSGWHGGWLFGWLGFG